MAAPIELGLRINLTVNNRVNGFFENSLLKLLIVYALPQHISTRFRNLIKLICLKADRETSAASGVITPLTQKVAVLTKAGGKQVNAIEFLPAYGEDFPTYSADLNFH